MTEGSPKVQEHCDVLKQKVLEEKINERVLKTLEVFPSCFFPEKEIKKVMKEVFDAYCKKLDEYAEVLRKKYDLSVETFWELIEDGEADVAVGLEEAWLGAVEKAQEEVVEMEGYKFWKLDLEHEDETIQVIYFSGYYWVSYDGTDYEFEFITDITDAIDLTIQLMKKEYVSNEEHNKIIDKTKELMKASQEKELDELGNKIAYLIEEKYSLSEKIDKIVDEWYDKICEEDGYDVIMQLNKIELKHKLKSSIGTETEKECSGGLASSAGKSGLSGLAVTVLPSEIPMPEKKALDLFFYSPLSIKVDLPCMCGGLFKKYSYSGEIKKGDAFFECNLCHRHLIIAYIIVNEKPEGLKVFDIIEKPAFDVIEKPKGENR